MLRFALVVVVAFPGIGCYVHEHREPYVEHREERRDERRHERHEEERHEHDDHRP